jgi:hypothetical protein
MKRARLIRKLPFLLLLFSCQSGNYLRIWAGSRKLNAIGGRAICECPIRSDLKPKLIDRADFIGVEEMLVFWLVHAGAGHHGNGPEWRLL